MRRLASLLALLLLATSLPAQSRLPMRGRVIDAATGEPIAEVLVAAGAARTTTGPDGRFTLTDGANLVRLLRLGFSPESVAFASGDSVVVAMRAAAQRLTPALIRAEQGMSAASSSVVRAFDLQRRPRGSAQELLQLVPGLVIAQHAGGGKAEQLFLRGFDADHGTDVAITVDGMPVNLVSHGHGQGYADLHFLIPEVVERLDVRKGPYDLRDGDLAVAGAVGYVTRDRVPSARLQLNAGAFGQRGATALAPFGGDALRPGGFVALSSLRSDGPFERPQGLVRDNLFAKFTAPVGGSQLSVALSSFRSHWDASGQVPARAVAQGRISRFGAIDTTEGGATDRTNLVASLAGTTAGGTRWSARAWGARSRFTLHSNFTFFADDPVAGDAIVQGDRRTLAGAQVEGRRTDRWLGHDGSWFAVAGARHDQAEVTLHGARDRVRRDVRSDARVRISNPFGGVERSIVLGDALRATVGARGDAFIARVDERAMAGAGGERIRGVVSPKLSIAWEARPALTLFGHAGSGFHSNDARAMVATGGQSLPVARGMEAGARYVGALGSVAAALWRLDLESELVWSGDGGTTEASGRTRRTGVDVEWRAALTPWLTADADVSIARGRFRDAPADARRIPLAPSLTSAGGLTATPSGWTLALRWRQIGSRPASEDGAVRADGMTLWESSLERRWGAFTLRAAVDNLFDRRWNEAQFATTSRLMDEAAPVTELHFTPGAPRALTVALSRAFR